MRSHPPGEVAAAVQAARDKQADDLLLLDLAGHCSFTDYFLICSASNPRKGQAISDEILLRLERRGLRPSHIEGYNQAEWILLDYVHFVVHIFSERARLFYDLERLWRSAPRISVEESR